MLGGLCAPSVSWESTRSVALGRLRGLQTLLCGLFAVPLLLLPPPLGAAVLQGLVVGIPGGHSVGGGQHGGQQAALLAGVRQGAQGVAPVCVVHAGRLLLGGQLCVNTARHRVYCLCIGDIET